MLTQHILTDPMTGGQKGVSPDRYDLIPPQALEALALVYGQGAQKYADNNWRKGYAWGYSFRALIKHAYAFWRGEWVDPESGLPHLAHTMWHCATLMTFHEQGLGTDTRSHTRVLPAIQSGDCTAPWNVVQDCTAPWNSDR